MLSLDADGNESPVDVAVAFTGLHPRQLGFFLGAGVSREPPSTIPTGQEIRRWIVECLVEWGMFHKHAEEHMTTLMPEVILEVVGKVFPGCLVRILPMLDSHTPNLRHRCLASLCPEAAISTLNFDCLIESAASQPTAVLHLHGAFGPRGTARFDNVTFNITRLRDGLPAALIDRWVELHRDNHLAVIAGYSDNDFDTMPLLVTNSIFPPGCRLFWHVHARTVRDAHRAIAGLSDEVLAWARTRGNVHFVHGDLSDFLSVLCNTVGRFPGPERISSIPTVPVGIGAMKSALQSSIAPDESSSSLARLTAAWLLGDAGYRSEALELLESPGVSANGRRVRYLWQHKLGDILREMDSKARAADHYRFALRLCPHGSPQQLETHIKLLHHDGSLLKRAPGMLAIPLLLRFGLRAIYVVARQSSAGPVQGPDWEFNTEADLAFEGADVLHSIGLRLLATGGWRWLGQRCLRMAVVRYAMVIKAPTRAHSLVFARLRSFEAQTLAEHVASMNDLTTAIRVYGAYRDTKGLASAYLAQGAHHARMGDSAEAVKGYERAWDLYEKAEHAGPGHLRLLQVAIIAHRLWKGPLPWGWSLSDAKQAYQSRRGQSWRQARA